MNRVSKFESKSSGATYFKVATLKVAAALFCILTTSALAPFRSAAVLAQSYSQYKSISGPGLKVVSVQEELDKRTIYLHLAEAVTVGRPHFNYLPGERGETVLIADFDGLTLNQTQSRNISLVERSSSQVRGNSSDNRFRNPSYTKFPGIKSVHIALAQVSPPKLRISFTADDPAVLKTVSVGAAPSVLKVSWGEVSGSKYGSSSNSGSSSSSSLVSKSAQAAPILASASAPTPAPAAKISSKNAASEAEPPLAPPIYKNDKSAIKEKDAKKIAKAKADSNEVSEKPSRGWFSRLKERTLDIIGLSEERSQIESEPDDKMKESSEAGQVQPKQPEKDNVGAAPVERVLPERVEDLGPPPLITLDKVDDAGKGALEIFRVELPNRKDLEYKSFRLQAPDRYVMDIKDMRSIVNAALPDAAASPLVRSIRVGVPNAEVSTGRLVLELEEGVTVDELFNQGSSYMTITLSKGLSQKNSSLSISQAMGQPIVVPRAPSETVIVLDAGHGGSDPGAQRSDVNEKDVTLAITAKLKKVLETKGARIVMTRSDDTFVSLEDRVKITNQVNPNLFLSVHINSLQSTSDIHGIETYYQTDRSLPLARRVHESLVTGLAAPDRSVRRARFYVINHTPVPAILAEVGYITNKTERDRLISSDYQNKIANALARGVMLYLQDVNKGSEELAGKQTSQIAASGNSKSAK